MCLFGMKLACPGQRIFELANALHHNVAEDEQSRQCFFAGKLVIFAICRFYISPGFCICEADIYAIANVT
jgi:hypothetical protein